MWRLFINSVYIVIYTFLRWSHAVLSVIFGIFGKFGIEIGTRENKLVEKKFVEKNPKTFGRFFLNFHQLFQRFFLSKKIEIFWSQFFSTKKFSDFFRRIFLGLPIPIPKFPKIPKITLRAACDHFKNTNSTHEKCTIFPQTPSWGSEVREPSV